ncbi:MAG: redox-regulated ATPase YchF [Proteobacteria bacterium]|nr:redox-regulated ATPase YchF [Pseudomonadota bacterium]
MKLGIIGLPKSGKTTIFETLTRNIPEIANKTESRIGTIKVPDGRVDILSDMYKPKKTIFAQVEYFLPGSQGQKKTQNIWTQVRDCDALIHVVRNFGGYGLEAPIPYGDFQSLDQELILADLVVIEKRVESLTTDKKRGNKANPEEVSLLEECLKNLENETPLRKCPDLAQNPLLKGFTFLSAKPTLVLFNNEEDDDAMPEAKDLPSTEDCLVIRGKLEHELAQMSDEDAADFLAEYQITSSAMDRVIKKSYDLLGLVSFFTVGDDEVRAWTIKKETVAVDAADVIHSDIKKGFIRAEVVFYDDLMEAGSHQEARKKGTVRLEGKTYPVKNGDIINFRFNV